MMNKKILTAFLIIMAAGMNLHSSPNGPEIKVSGVLDWEKNEMEAVFDLDLNSINARFPAGRSQAEEILRDEFPGLMKPLLLNLQADSSSTVEDLIMRGELGLRNLDEVCNTAIRIPPNFSADLTRFTGKYSMRISQAGAAMIRHRSAGEPDRPVLPVPAANYTGIIIIANNFLPVHGRNITELLRPCLFPKIWDSGMNLIYEKNMTDPSISGTGRNGLVRYAKGESIFRPTPSGLDPELAMLVGDRPLRIFAASVFGAVPTDPIIDRADAQLILANENNRRLLREGRIAIIINDTLLQQKLP